MSAVLIVNYSEKSCAILGETKKFKDELKSAGARFNAHLKVEGKVVAGWIIPKDRRGTFEGLLFENKTQTSSNINACLPTSEMVESDVAESKLLHIEGTVDEESLQVEAESNAAVSSEEANSANVIVRVVDYSNKSFAVFGETKAMKDVLKSLGGKFSYLTHNDSKAAGWIFPMTLKPKLLSSLQSASKSKSEIQSRTGPGMEIEFTFDTTSLPQFNAGAKSVASAVEGLIVVKSYSDKSSAVLGDSRPYKDTMKEMGGRFNASLRRDDEDIGEGGDDQRRCPGWVFPSSKLDGLLSRLNAMKVPLKILEKSVGNGNDGEGTDKRKLGPGKLTTDIAESKEDGEEYYEKRKKYREDEEEW